MKLIRVVAGLLLVLLLWPQSESVSAYELMTHAKVSGRAFDTSERVRMYLEDVGIKVSDLFDQESAEGRESTVFAGFRNTGTLRGWMTAGAIREDDFQPHSGCRQPLNPPSAMDRPLNHFFDVQRGGRGLTVLGLERGVPAPDWALGLQGRGPDDTQNQFSVLDARAYQLRSLTAPTRDERDRNTALLFRTLGHVIHALEDTGQPQHTRNDPHAGCFQFIAGEHSWFEDYMETRARGIAFRARSLPSPPLLLDGYSPVGFQAYRDYWTNPTLSGLADFSSRNFLSAGTNLGRNCDGLPEPPCSPDAYGQREVTISVLTISGTPLTGTVRLFNRRMRDPVTGGMVTTRDPVTGEITEDVPVTSRSVWDQHLETRGLFPLFSLNTLNYDSVSDVLLPRAVGYAAGLLDHFFRGKLDVDLVPADPNDPSVVRVSGANASTDVLQGGTLTLYADGPTDPTGKRDPAAALDQDLTVTAESGAPVESARFRVPGDTERFMVVYKGTLGQEAETGTFPGGVVGKVLGGVRVEEVFSDGTRWKLRTPRGVFVLQGLTPAEFEKVRWGDGDSLLVALTPFGPGQPNRVAAYEVGRQPGSMELVTVNTPGGPEVPVVKKNEAAFPFGMSLDTTVEFSQTIHYRQLVPTFQVTGIYEYVPIPGQPGAINYIGPTLEFTPLQIGTPVSQTVRFAESFPIRLDLARQADSWTMWRPYVWYLQDVAASASGRLLGLVLVWLTEPDVPRVSLPFYGLNPSTGPEVTGQVDFTPSFPAEVNPLLWAVVDLKEGRVVVSTAEAVITISSEEGRETFLEAPRLGAIVADHGLEAYNGGPLAGVYDRGWFALPLVSPDGLPPIGELTELPPSQGGILTISADGWLRGDLKDELGRLGLSTFQMNARQVSGDAVYLCLPTSCKAIRHMTTVSEVVRSPATLDDARRSRPVPGGERVVFLTGSGTAGPTLLVWDPETPKAKVVHQFPASEGPVLGPATRTTAMIFSFVLQGEMLLPSTMLIPLDGSRPPTAFPGEDLSLSFALLDQNYLYHVGEQKFYRPKPSLQPTALPARLADVPGNPVGDYHAIRLP